MKRFLSLSLVICMVLGLCSCGAKKTGIVEPDGAKLDLNKITTTIEKKNDNGFKPKIGIYQDRGYMDWQMI